MENPIKQIGPGLGLRGKLRWLASNDDVRGIILWTYAASESEDTMTEVDEIHDKLRQEHNTIY